MSGAGLGATAARFSRRRRKTFSTSMIASSTTSPIAIARPPSVSVLIVAPSRSRRAALVLLERLDQGVEPRSADSTA
jgi:hypothetical protein